MMITMRRSARPSRTWDEMLGRSLVSSGLRKMPGMRVGESFYDGSGIARVAPAKLKVET
jgi:hypothetical protein